MHRFRRPLILLLLLFPAATLHASEPTRQGLEQEFAQQVVPLIEEHCLGCHDAETQEAMLDLSSFETLQDVTAAHALWETVMHRVESGEMPPPDAAEPLNEEQRRQIAGWVQSVRQFEAAQHAGDPGPTLVRRLSNAEYDYSIRDLTGVDIQPTATFPVDPANEAGFDNSSESLRMSPALMKKYLQAARMVAEHLVFTPRGIRFAPHPVVTDTDRDKYCVKRIVAFYERQPTDYANYFFASWRFRHRDESADPEVTLEAMAREEGVSAKYLQTVWSALNEERAEFGPLAKLQSMWNELPDRGQSAEARTACEQMRDFVVEMRKPFEPSFDNLSIEGVHPGSQPFVLWKNDQYAKNRRTADFSFLERDDADSDHAIQVPSDGDRERFLADCRRFCDVFPDAFYVSERGRDYLGKPRDEQEKGRLLSAGFHSMMGYYRDDQPLYELVLDEEGRRALDALWEELDFFTAAPLRQYQGFLWFERTDSRFMRDPQFDFARAEDRAALREEMIDRLADVYLEKATANGGEEVPLNAIRDYFDEINEQIRWVENARREAEPRHLAALVDLAERAYRRPLSEAEAEELRAFYHELRTVEEQPHEEAIQDTLVSILMSPHFCYRVDLLSDSERTRTLDDYELASRLSYFLWSSLPDEELLQCAANGNLRRPEVLIEQTRRMLQDERMRGLATEFVGNWLDFRRFEEHNSVDRERFPSFDNALRTAMFEEPIRFFIDVVQRDRSILDFLYADRTFVNAALAKHYGMNDLELAEGEWREVTDAGRYGRGGLLPMAVFLTKNAPGLRTSPVKRGYWVVRRLLGERIPPPPPNVPELPADESQLGERTLRETLAQHREHASCAACHDRFDALGLVFEGYGPIGERRSEDLGGRPVEVQAVFPDGSERSGVEDLRRYLQEEREAEFVDNICRKLLSYALGRTLLLSDERLLQEMRREAEADEFRFRRLVETIVTSPQFLNKRGRVAPADATVAAKDSNE